MTAHSRQALTDLVQWNGQINELIDAARSAPWDGLSTVVLDRMNARAALCKVLAGAVLPSDLTTWTEALAFLP
jgi:hypothetical protein